MLVLAFPVLVSAQNIAPSKELANPQNVAPATDTTSPQEIVTAADYFDQVSAKYREIQDYQAHIVITQDSGTMEGTIYNKRPNMLLIMFTNPKDQVISVNGQKMEIYIPDLNVVMEQTFNKATTAPTTTSAITLASGQGLDLMKSRYTIAYLDTQDAVPLDSSHPELVHKLKLQWRSPNEGFREITLSIDKNDLIRRIVGVTENFAQIQLDFTNIVVNQGIPDARFKYDPPPTATSISNFIFQPGQ